MTFVPLNKRVVIRPDKVDKVTARPSGIVLTAPNDDGKPTGTLLSWSEDCEMPHESGVRLMYNLYGYDRITEDGEELHVLPEADLIGYYEPQE
jgi:co-chaperonin GroES (HSP10)